MLNCVEKGTVPFSTEVEGAFPLNRGISRSAGGWIVWPLKTSSESFLWLFVQYSVDTGHKGAGRVSFPNQS